MRHFFSIVKHYVLVFSGLASMLLIGGCKLTLLNPKGPIASNEKQILIIATLLMLAIVVPVIILTLSFAWRYRAGNSKAKYSPNWAHSLVLETIWWSASCFVIGILGAITWISTHQLDPYKPLDIKKKKVLTIQAIALEWKWLFIYPEQNIATVNFVQFPTDRPVRFLITAEGPMNSLQIPQLAGQIYAMAGMQTKLNLMADTPGDYRGISANFSGEGFSDMKFVARASTEAEFIRWVKNVRQSSQRLSMSAYNKLIKPSMNHRVEYYAATHQRLFDTVVMKSMMPVKEANRQILASQSKENHNA